MNLSPNMRPVLQLRWRVEGATLVYYGLRRWPHTLRRTLFVGGRAARLLATLDGVRPLSAYPSSPVLRRLIRLGIVVDVKDRRVLPQGLDQARFCARCAANDYAIPGLELDEEGLCPMCRTRARFARYKNVLPVVDAIPPAPGRKYDAAVFYTGGKDSSYLLYHLAREQGLRVLALCWETPFMSDWARQSVERARRALPEVDFLVEAAPEGDLRRIYRRVYDLQGNVCICPSVAYVLFFQRLVEWRVPYLILGNEPAQCLNLLYNGMAPPLAFRPWAQALARWGANLLRLLTLRPPLRRGQLELYLTVRQLAFGPHPLLKLIRYRNELVEHTCEGLAQAPALMAPFRGAVRRAGRTGRLPALVHVDLDAAAGGVYRWEAVKEVLQREIGWVDAPQEGKGLHTSCAIERCKEWSQFTRFRAMESGVIPFSALELALASGEGALTRAQAMGELARHTGFTPDPPPETARMEAFLADP